MGPLPLGGARDGCMERECTLLYERDTIPPEARPHAAQAPRREGRAIPDAFPRKVLELPVRVFLCRERLSSHQQQGLFKALHLRIGAVSVCGVLPGRPSKNRGTGCRGPTCALSTGRSHLATVRSASSRRTSSGGLLLAADALASSRKETFSARGHARYYGPGPRIGGACAAVGMGGVPSEGLSNLRKCKVFSNSFTPIEYSSSCRESAWTLAAWSASSGCLAGGGATSFAPPPFAALLGAGPVSPFALWEAAFFLDGFFVTDPVGLAELFLGVDPAGLFLGIARLQPSTLGLACIGGDGGAYIVGGWQRHIESSSFKQIHIKHRAN